MASPARPRHGERSIPVSGSASYLTPAERLGKQVKAAAVAAGTSEKSQHYWNFWGTFLSTLTERHPTWTNRKTSSRDNFYDLSTGTSGAVYSLTFGTKGLRLQLYFNGTDELNLARFLALQSMKDDFEQVLGEQAEWVEKPGMKSASVAVVSQFTDVAEVDRWPVMIDWLIDQLARFRRAIDAVGGLAAWRENTDSAAAPGSVGMLRSELQQGGHHPAEMLDLGG